MRDLIGETTSDGLSKRIAGNRNIKVFPPPVPTTVKTVSFPAKVASIFPFEAVEMFHVRRTFLASYLANLVQVARMSYTLYP